MKAPVLFLEPRKKPVSIMRFARLRAILSTIYASLDMSISLSYSDTISIAENDSILQKMTRTRCKNIIDNIFINQNRTANIRCPILITDRYMFLLR